MTPGEKYQMFMRGFRDGCGTGIEKHPEIEEYRAGFRRGVQARIKESKVACELYDYTPSVLRSVDASQ